MSVDTAALNDDLEFLFHDDRSLEKRLAGADREVARILDRALAGEAPGGRGCRCADQRPRSAAGPFFFS